jgi:transposase-like protein
MTDPVADGGKPWREEEVLRRLYIEEDLTQSEVADRLDCDRHTVGKWVREYGLSKGPSIELAAEARRVGRATHRINHHGYETWVDQNTKVPVHRLLAVAKYGFDALRGNEVHHKNGVTWDNRFENIEVLDPTEHRAKHDENADAPWRDRGRLAEAYQSATSTELGERWGVDPSTIVRWLQRHDIPRRSSSEAMKEGWKRRRGSGDGE